MPAASAVGQPTAPHGGYAGSNFITGDNGVQINGQPISVIGSQAAPHVHPQHAPHPPAAAGGSGTVLVNGVPIHRNGDPESCGSQSLAVTHVIVGG